jgi:hypothetical protein
MTIQQQHRLRPFSARLAAAALMKRLHGRSTWWLIQCRI